MVLYPRLSHLLSFFMINHTRKNSSSQSNEIVSQVKSIIRTRAFEGLYEPKLTLSVVSTRALQQDSTVGEPRTLDSSSVLLSSKTLLSILLYKC